jgi:hypothetical protein
MSRLSYPVGVKRLNIFGEKELRRVLEDKIQEMQSEIENNSDDYTLNVNEAEYIGYLVTQYTIRNLELRLSEVFASSYEKDIPAEQLPKYLFDLPRNGQYTKDVIRYHIPFAGAEGLLYCRPSQCLPWTTEVTIEDDCVCFEIINFYNDAGQIKREADETIARIERQLNNVRQEVARYNSSLEGHAQRLFQLRKQHVLEKHNVLASLGVPIRRRDDLPQTFAIPTPRTRRKIQISKPSVTEKGYKADPTLDAAIYEEILQVMHDLGRQFERMPSTYVNKHEEDLRDHFLLYLEPRFEGSATGETFNKSGKTDILVRFEGSNAFIAECKFWKGPKSFLETDTQLLGYLTWRDSKSAVVMFVKSKDFSSVIKAVEDATPKHPNYLGFVNRKDESWLNYRFHIDGDPNREVKLAVLLFHFPSH